jgi:hypothetical protein
MYMYLAEPPNLLCLLQLSLLLSRCRRILLFPHPPFLSHLCLLGSLRAQLRFRAAARREIARERASERVCASEGGREGEREGGSERTQTGNTNSHTRARTHKDQSLMSVIFAPSSPPPPLGHQRNSLNTSQNMRNKADGGWG